jgi:hypothetical protein
VLMRRDAHDVISLTEIPSGMSITAPRNTASGDRRQAIDPTITPGIEPSRPGLVTGKIVKNQSVK